MSFTASIDPLHIPVHMNYRPDNYFSQLRLPPVRRVIRRDNKVLQARSLPKLSCYNMRSLMPKCVNFGTDMDNRSCSVSFLTEVWQVAENKKHQQKIEELFELKGLKYISTPRPGTRRGGGAAIVVNTDSFSLSKLNVPIPHCLEIVWGLMRPLEITGKVTKIIVCSFYSPPRSTKKSLLIDHMTFTLQNLLNTFPEAGILICGDRNDLGIDRLLSIDTSLSQIVNKNTRGAKILDVILTNLGAYYDEPEIVPPIEVDDPLRGGVPSGHAGVGVAPRGVPDNKPFRHKITRKIRPITNSAINNIGQVVANEPWNFMNPSLSPTHLTELFEYFTGGIVDTFCPVKVVHSRPDDKPWITEDIKIIKRKLQREYERKGNSVKYYDLKNIYENKLKKEAQKYKEKLLQDVRNGDRNSCYAALRKLGARPGESSGSQFTLPAHIDQSLTAGQSAELIADHFAAISQSYEPISLDSFPPKLRDNLRSPNISIIPQLEEFEVFKRICKSKKPNSSVPGDLPKKVVQELSCELTTPVTIIFNSILRTMEYPRQWVKEYQVPIPKVSNPNSEDDLRNISKTAFFSKVFESFLADWLMPIVGPYLDPCQYGIKGTSINHYMFKLLKFIHEYLDLKNPHAVVIALIDLSKAFNRVSHSLVIEDLHDMHVPPWLLLILISYLSGRSMILSYNGASSSPKHLPGSSPQGVFLGIFFFIVKYNGVSLRPSIPRIMFNQKCRAKYRTCDKQSCKEHTKTMHALYVDDRTDAVAIDMKKQLMQSATPRSFPLNYHERTGHVLPPGSALQKQLHNIEQFTEENQMKINVAKTKVMMFNKSQNYNFPPEFSFEN